MTSSPRILELSGPELEPWIDALGELRIRVFREFPYLYDGSLAYERQYLQTYRDARRSRVVLVCDENGRAVGASTCVPLIDEDAAFQAPFAAAGFPIDRILYLGESVLLPEWRGKGIGKHFFDLREAHAERLGMTLTTFCAVDRPNDHPLRPPDYQPLDRFWQARGYSRQPSLTASFPWKEIDAEAETPKTLTFWTRPWNR